jgi:CheY-like chemotaxis protein
LSQGPAVAAAAPQRAVTGYLGARRRILVVDDGEDNRSLLEVLLGELGFEVSVARDGIEGVTAAATGHPDLIVMDSMMPRMDGHSAVQHIKSMPPLAHTPILMVSADVTAENRARAAAAGVDGFLSKPLRRPELIAQLGALLALEWRYAEAAETPAAPAPAAGLVPPPVPQLQAWYELAQLGDVLQLARQAGEAVRQDLPYSGFAQQVETLARDLRSKAIVKLIQPYLDEAVR